MSKPIVIGFLGYKHSGKSTAADYLIAKYGAVRYSLAAPLKLIAKDLFDLTDAQMYGTPEDKETVDPRWGKSPRKIMETLGQAARDYLWYDVWLDKLAKDMTQSSQPLLVLDDIRYVNEARYIANSPAFTGRVIRVVNPDQSSEPVSRSESEIEEATNESAFCILNNKTEGKAALAEQIDLMLNTVLSDADYLRVFRARKHGD